MALSSKSIKKRSISTRNFVLALLLLVIANTVMGIVLMFQSRSAMRTQISQRMLDVSNTAAYMVDGDILGELTKDDKGTPKYQSQLAILSSFQENIELSYIYGIDDDGNGNFTFTIDPDPDSTSAFGEPILTTNALKKAAAGTAAVDSVSHEDQWGRFYSAYSPVFDSDGNVAGIIGVDFDADWYDEQLSRLVYSIITISAISLVSGIMLAIGLARRMRKRFEVLETEMKAFDDAFLKLNDNMMINSIRKLDMMPEKECALLKTLASGETYRGDKAGDEITDIAHHIHTMQDHLRHYLSYIESQTYVDQMTGVSNKLAYKQTIRELTEKVEKHTARFVISFFDINSLDRVNTVYGFEKGDELLYGAASVLKSVYQTKNVYRVASDEFIAISEEKGRLDAEDDFKKLDEAIRRFNDELGEKPYLSIAKGFSVFDPEAHSGYRAAFIDAADAMHKDKADYHSRKGGVKVL